MIEEVARVLSVDNDYVTVEVEKTSGCGSCNAKGACGTSSLAGFFNFKAPALTVKNTLNAKVGDSVLLALPEQTLLIGSMLLYILPLVGMILFAGLASVFQLSEGELPQIGLGVFGLFFGLFLSRKLSSKLMKQDDTAKMVKLFSRQVVISSDQLIS